MSKIIEVANNLEKINLFEYTVHCPLCGNKQFSLFDKLYTESFGKCVMDSTEEEAEINGNQIFAIMI